MPTGTRLGANNPTRRQLAEQHRAVLEARRKAGQDLPIQQASEVPAPQTTQQATARQESAFRPTESDLMKLTNERLEEILSGLGFEKTFPKVKRHLVHLILERL